MFFLYAACAKFLFFLYREEEETTDAKMLLSPTNSQRKTNPFLTVWQDPGAKVYQQGLLARKVHAEADGKKSECWVVAPDKQFSAVP